MVYNIDTRSRSWIRLGTSETDSERFGTNTTTSWRKSETNSRTRKTATTTPTTTMAVAAGGSVTSKSYFRFTAILAAYFTSPYHLSYFGYLKDVFMSSFVIHFTAILAVFLSIICLWFYGHFSRLGMFHRSLFHGLTAVFSMVLSSFLLRPFGQYFPSSYDLGLIGQDLTPV